ISAVNGSTSFRFRAAASALRCSCQFILSTLETGKSLKTENQEKQGKRFLAVPWTCNRFFVNFVKCKCVMLNPRFAQKSFIHVRHSQIHAKRRSYVDSSPCLAHM